MAHLIEFRWLAPGITFINCWLQLLYKEIGKNHNNKAEFAPATVNCMPQNESSLHDTISLVLTSENISGVKIGRMDRNYMGNMLNDSEGDGESGDPSDPAIVTSATSKLPKLPLLYKRNFEGGDDEWDENDVTNVSSISTTGFPVPRAVTEEPGGLFSWPFGAGAWAVIGTGGVLVFLLICCFCYFRTRSQKPAKREEEDEYYDY